MNREIDKSFPQNRCLIMLLSAPLGTSLSTSLCLRSLWCKCLTWRHMSTSHSGVRKETPVRQHVLVQPQTGQQRDIVASLQKTPYCSNKLPQRTTRSETNCNLDQTEFRPHPPTEKGPPVLLNGRRRQRGRPREEDPTTVLHDVGVGRRQVGQALQEGAAPAPEKGGCALFRDLLSSESSQRKGNIERFSMFNARMLRVEAPCPCCH